MTRALAAARRHAAVLLLLAVVAGGAWLRLSGSNWDDGAHLHPDERYLSMVADGIRAPDGVAGYFDVERSPLSPYSTETGRGYVYGTLPLFAVKAAAAATGRDDYGHLNLLGRQVSALLDTLEIVVVFLVALLACAALGRRQRVVAALLGAALYGGTVTAVQHAHFFTTDVWVTLLGMLALLAALAAVRSAVTRPDGGRALGLLALAGLALGGAAACKVSGLLAAVPVGIALAGHGGVVALRAGGRAAALRSAAAGLLVAVCAYVAFRLASPYAFAHSSWLDLRPDERLRAALEQQRTLSSGDTLLPPAYQWLLSPRVWGPLENLVVWQLGVPLGLAALAGLGILAARSARGLAALGRRGRGGGDRAEALGVATAQAMLVGYAAAVFLVVSTSFSHSGRYLLPIAPVLAVAAAYGLVATLAGRPRLLAGAAALVVGATGLYALAFHHVYVAQTTRLAASAWIVEHVPPGATIANEHWDDPLPVGGDAQRFRGLTLPVFDPDDGTKLHKLYSVLAAADYYAVSSPRASRTIGRLPDRFPLMTRFYGELFAGRLGFTPAARFASGPELLGVRLDDVRAEEAFWVYDHPPVTVFRRERRLRWDAFRRALCPEPRPPYCA